MNDNLKDKNPLSQQHDATLPDAMPNDGAEKNQGENGNGKKEKKHLIKNTFLRRTLKTLGWIVVVILLIPALLYVPPVQTLVKDIACSYVEKSTGMHITIDGFRLGFPLKVALDGVSVVEATGDTIAAASKAEVDVALLPLLSLDVKLKKLDLTQGYYRMVSPDSSMIMKIRAGKLTVDDKSSANIAKSEIHIGKAFLKDGDVQLYMNVWKKKYTPADSTATPFLITANDLDVENIHFGMSMLPTIDTLNLTSASLRLKKGIIDLRRNSVALGYATVADGEMKYITPTPEYIASHPAPPPGPPSPPMTITGDSISLSGFNAVYAVKGARPAEAGFNPSYINATGVAISLNDFFNQSSTVRLPIASMAVDNMAGLRIVEGKGTVAIDSIGLNLADLHIATPFTSISASADIPFAMMSLQPQAKMSCKANGHIGVPDIEAFMPAVKSVTSRLPGRKPVNFTVDAAGSLERLLIARLDVAMPQAFSINASGEAGNVLDMKKLTADVDFRGSLTQPSIIEAFTGKTGFNIPSLDIDGYAIASNQEYEADFRLLTSAGDIAANGSVSLNSERYDADIDIHALDVGKIMPSLGIGPVTASLSANGDGFNPLKPSAATDVVLDLSSIVYNRKLLENIHASASLHDSHFDITATSLNQGLDFDIAGTGTIAPDDYTFNLDARLRHVDLMALGLSPTMSNGNGNIHVEGTASPDKWLYDVDLAIDNFDWNLPDNYIHMPAGATAFIRATPDSTRLRVDSYLTSIDFTSSDGLKKVIDGFTATADAAMKQVDKRNLDIDALQPQLPRFTLDVDASGHGLLKQFLTTSEMSVDTVSLNLCNDSIITARAEALEFKSASINADTITFDLTQRNGLLNYIAHMGNRPGTFDEFADVNLRGYVGSNRASAYLVQKNITQETGYRLGLTAGIEDDIVTVHFTPLNATIAYMPWKLNDDNFIDYNIKNNVIHANLGARSRESSLLIKTQPLPAGGDELVVKLDNIHIEELLQMSVLAPPVTATIDSDIHVIYDGHKLNGDGTVNISNFTYEKTQIGDFDFNLHAGVGLDGNTEAKIGLNIDSHEAMALNAGFKSGSDGLEVDQVKLVLTKFPLKIANAFLGPDIASLSGGLSGAMDMTGSFTRPVLNGSIMCDSVSAYIPMIGTVLNFSSDPITVDHSFLRITGLDIKAANDNPLVLKGTVDLSDFSNMKMDLAANASNFQLIGNNYKAKSDIYGKLFMNLNATLKGNMKALNADANLSILGTTDLTYQVSSAQQSLQQAGNGDDVVKFVNFNDSTQVLAADSIKPALSMRVNASVNIAPGTEITVNLSSDGTDRVQLHPYGTLNYFQNYMGDMKLNGQLNTGTGQAKYRLPVVGQRIFDFNPDSYILWNGQLMNPVLNIHVTDNMKANVVQSGGNSQLVNFTVFINATNTLAQPSLSFDLSTNDDMSIQNEIESMSADQRSTQAMNLLLYGQYTGQNSRTSASKFTGNMLYGLLTSQLNSLTSRYVKGVDLSFGIDQYDRTVDGSTSTATNYSYQLSKSLFNNRFKIVVGGNYSTDTSSDDIAQNLISDISFEYILKQTNTLNMSAKLFRHTGYESILEGEITEMGVGFVMRRKLTSLFNIFRFRKRKRQPAADHVHADSLQTDSLSNVSGISLTNDSTQEKRK